MTILSHFEYKSKAQSFRLRIIVMLGRINVVSVLCWSNMLFWTCLFTVAWGLVTYNATTQATYRSGGLQHLFGVSPVHRGVPEWMPVHMDRVSDKDNTLLWFHRASRCAPLQGVT